MKVIHSWGFDFFSHVMFVVMRTFATFDDNALQRSLERFRKLLDSEIADRNLPAPPEVDKNRFKSYRAELLNGIYTQYEISYKKNTWSDYRRWLAKNRFKHSSQKMEEFKKSKDFHPKISVKSFCSYWLGFLKNNDLHFILSIGKDMNRRGSNFNKWLFWAIKKQ